MENALRTREMNLVTENHPRPRGNVPWASEQKTRRKDGYSTVNTREEGKTLYEENKEREDPCAFLSSVLPSAAKKKD